MSGLAVLARTGNAFLRRKIIQQECQALRCMGGGGSTYDGGVPPHLTGGMFKNPVGKPPSDQEISDWVKKDVGDTWRSLGWSEFDPRIDKEQNNLFFFFCVTVSLVGVTFMFAYSPRAAHKDWCIREAYLLLRDREAAGVEPISKELCDPVKTLAHLPSDEELKEAGVVINI